MFFNATEILIDSFVQKLREGYRRTYGGYKPDYADIIAWAGNMGMENISNSDTLYHVELLNYTERFVHRTLKPKESNYHI